MHMISPSVGPLLVSHFNGPSPTVPSISAVQSSKFRDFFFNQCDLFFSKKKEESNI